MIEKQTLKEFVDCRTGEVLQYESTKTVRKKVDSENFYMVFFDHLKIFPSLKRSGVNNLILQQLCKLAEFNTGKVTISVQLREDLCRELEISSAQFTNALKALKDDELITGSRGSYKINPQVFWKGDQKIRRDELLKDKELKITYEIVDVEKDED